MGVVVAGGGSLQKEPDRGGRIIEIDSIVDANRVGRLAAAVLSLADCPGIVLRTPVRGVGPRGLAAEPERSFVRSVSRRDPELVVVPPGREDPEHDLRPIG